MKKGFDNELYVKKQSEIIRERLKMFDKLYVEFGGKLLDDYHATRVLPGFELDSKINFILNLKKDIEVILCINAKDIEKKKIRADYGTTYDMEIVRLINNLRDLEIEVNNVVVTLYKGESSILKFKKRMKSLGVKTYLHTFTKGYPTDVDMIVSDEGYGANPYIETTKKIVIVNAPGANSGKLATCLSQLYHEYKKGVKAGYAKFETFPVWNLPLKHPINIAYEAATADLRDVNMIDSFHLEKYGISAVNYNRDLEVFPVIKNILAKIMGTDIYYSPTDMGINTIKDCIIDDNIVVEASNQEVIRRYYQALCNYKQDIVPSTVPERIKILMNELNIDTDARVVVNYALEKQNKCKKRAVALELLNGKIITGRQTNLLSPVSSLIINSIKELTNIPDEVDLISPSVLEPILKIKPKTIDKQSYYLNLQEVLIALSICAVTNPIIEKALNNLAKLKGCEAHATYILDSADEEAIKNLKINLTCEPEFYYENINKKD